MIDFQCNKRSWDCLFPILIDLVTMSMMKGKSLFQETPNLKRTVKKIHKILYIKLKVEEGKAQKIRHKSA